MVRTGKKTTTNYILYFTVMIFLEVFLCIGTTCRVMASPEEELVGSVKQSKILRYDDRWDVEADYPGYQVQTVSTTQVTSNRVQNGKVMTYKDVCVLAMDENRVRAKGIGTGVVTLANKAGDMIEISVTVEPAVLTLILVSGQSNAEGANSYGSDYGWKNSVMCESGTVYSTYVANKTEKMMKLYGQSGYVPFSIEGADDYIPGSLGVGKSISGKELFYPIDALTEKANGKAGMDAAIAYQWNKLTGGEEKVWIVNTSIGTTKIQSWVPGESSYEAMAAVLERVDKVMDAEMKAGHYVRGHRFMIWLQGEANRTQTAQTYLEYFDKLYNAMVNQWKMELFGIVTVRATDYTVAGANDIAMNGPRVAEYLINVSNQYDKAYIVSNVNEQWLTDAAVKKYFKEKYPDGIFTYPMREENTAVVPTTVEEVHASIHYSSVGHNENGLDAASHAYEIIKKMETGDIGTGSGETRVLWRDKYGNSYDSLSLENVSAMYLYPDIYPKENSKNLRFISNTNYMTYDLEKGYLQITRSLNGKLITENTVTGQTLTSLPVLAKMTMTTPSITSAAVSEDGIKITWSKVKYASKYVIYRRKDKGKFVRYATSSGLTYTDKNVEVNSSYYYRVVAQDSVSTSATSNTASIKYLVPKVVIHEMTEKYISVKWSEVGEKYTYMLQKKVGEVWTNLVAGSVVRGQDSAVMAGQRYQYRLIAKKGIVTYTGAVSEFCYLGLGPVSAKVVAGTANSKLIKWNVVPGATKYYIYKRKNTSTWTRVAVVKGTSYSVSATEVLAGYEYVIKAANSETYSSQSNIVTP